MFRTELLRLTGMLSVLVYAFSGLAPAQTVPLPEGVKAVWNMSKAHKETTPTRQRICINGLWRWQPMTGELSGVPRDNWGWFKVPGAWPNYPSRPWLCEESQKVLKHPSWAKTSLNKISVAWYQREITVPRKWKKRRVVVSCDLVDSYAAVYVDGKNIGAMVFPGGGGADWPTPLPGW